MFLRLFVLSGGVLWGLPQNMLCDNANTARPASTRVGQQDFFLQSSDVASIYPCLLRFDDFSHPKQPKRYCPRGLRRARGAHITGVAVNWCGSEVVATYNPSGEIYRFDVKKNAASPSSSSSSSSSDDGDGDDSPGWRWGVRAGKGVGCFAGCVVEGSRRASCCLLLMWDDVRLTGMCILVLSFLLFGGVFLFCFPF